MARKKLLIKRGESAGLPTLDYGELAYTRDTQKFYIGTPTGNVQLNTGLTANQQTLLEFWNGTFLESFDATVTSDGATITMSLEQTGGGDLTMVFNDGFTTLDCTPAATIALTAGSDTSPQENFIYIPQSTKVLTKSTSDWPSGEHIRVAKLIVQSAGTVQTDGALFNQNWNDHAKGTDSQGHLTHMGQKIRDFGGTWRDGVAPTITITPQVGVPDNVDISTTSGRIFQMHLQTYPARDTSTGSPVHVPNDSATAWTTVTDLEDLLTDNTGASMSGRYFNLVFWGIINKTGQTQVMCCNLPGGSYVKESDALNDVSGYDVFTIPAAFKNNGFLILRVTFQHSTASGGTWTSIREDDLRGTLPAVQAEGGPGAAVTEFADNNFKIFDEGDATKELQFQVSGVSPSTTRTLTIPDENGTIITNQGGTMVGQLFIDGSADEIQLLVQGNATQNANILEVETSAATNIFTVSTTALQMGLLADHNIVINSSGITGDVASGTTLFFFSAATSYVGNTSSLHAEMDASNFMIMDQANNMFGIDSAGGAKVYGYTDTVQLTVTGNASQTSNYFVVENSGGTDLVYVNSSGAVMIDGSADTVQLTVQANATQTGPALVVETSGGTDKVSLWSTGIITLAPDTNVGTLVSGNQVVTGTGSVTYSLIGGTFAASSTSGSSAIAGMTPTMLAGNASGTFSAVYGVANAIYGRTSGAGTVTNVYGVRLQPYASAGTITNLYGLYYDTPVGTGITNQYALFIENVSGATANYSIYTGTGAAFFGDRMVIDGTQDAIQLRIQAWSTQTNNLLVLENSGGTDLVYVDGDGRFLVGGNVGTQSLTLSHHKWTAALTTGNSYFALQAQLYDTSANSASNTAMRGNAYSGHTSGTIGNTVGVASLAYAAGSGGTTTNLIGFRTDSDVTSGATVTSRFGLYIAAATGVGTLTNNYGVYIASQTKGTTSYSIFTGTGLVYLQDQTSVVGTQDIVQLRVYANGTQTANVITVYDSSATAVFQVKDDRVLVYGGGASTNHRFGVLWADVAAASSSYYCMDMAVYNTTAGSAALIGARGICFANSTGAITGSFTGLIGSIYQNAAGGSLSAGIGVRAQIIANNATGTISSATGFQCDSFTATGTITTAYGLYIGAMTSAGTNYAIFTNQGLNELNDQLYVDGSADRYQLRVDAHSTQTTDLAVFLNSAGTQLVAIGGGGGIEVGVPTGGNKGNGTINTAGDIYKNNSAYTNPDYALEFWIKDGIIEVHKDKPGAAGYYRMSLDELGEYIKKHFRLPRMDDKPMGIFDRADRMLEKVEELTTYILELHERIKVLEEKLEAKQ